MRIISCNEFFRKNGNYFVHMDSSDNLSMFIESKPHFRYGGFKSFTAFAEEGKRETYLLFTGRCNDYYELYEVFYDSFKFIFSLSSKLHSEITAKFYFDLYGTQRYSNGITITGKNIGNNEKLYVSDKIIFRWNQKSRMLPTAFEVKSWPRTEALYTLEPF